MGRQGRRVWLSWHDHSRSRSIAGRLGVPLRSFRILPTGAVRHVYGSLWTIGQLMCWRPRLILLQNSFLLLLICALYRRIRGSGVRIVVDCHNKSLRRSLDGPLAGLFHGLKRWSFRQAAAVIVSNTFLVPEARELNGTVFVLRDPLPHLAKVEPAGSERYRHQSPVLFVCSFEPDEPRDLIFALAERLAEDGDREVVITGHAPAGSVPEVVARHPRIQLPGFVDRPHYEKLLLTAGVVVVLSEDRDCLMCGAYEALGAEKPLVLSDHPLLRQYFKSCASYARHRVDELVIAIEEACRKEWPDEAYRRDRDRFEAGFAPEWDELTAFLQDGGRPSRRIQPSRT